MSIQFLDLCLFEVDLVLENFHQPKQASLFSLVLTCELINMI